MHSKDYAVDDRGWTDTRGAADYTGDSVSGLNKRRHFGNGPRYVKHGRTVRYSYAELDRYLTAGVRTCTREAAA